MAWAQQVNQVQPMPRTQQEMPRGDNRRGNNRREQNNRGGNGAGANGRPNGQALPASQTAKFINTAICAAASKGDIQGLLNVVATRQAEMSCVNLSTALHKLARMVKEDQRALTFNNSRVVMLHRRTETVLESQLASGVCMPRCWATIAWAYATLQFRDAEVERLFHLLGQLALPRLRDFKTFELTNLLWGFAKIHMPNRPLFLAASHHIMANLGLFSPSNLATIVWAIVTAKDYQPSVLHKLTAEFSHRFDVAEVNPVELSNMLWGLATAKVHPSGTLLQEIGMRAIPLLKDFKVQELSITAWAFSRLGARHDQFFAAASMQLCHSPVLRQQMHAQGIANLLWAFERQETLGGPIRAHFGPALTLLIPTCQELLPWLKPQEFTCVFRALGKFGVYFGMSDAGDWLFECAATMGHPVLRKISTPQCVDLLEAYARFTLGAGAAIPEVCRGFIEALVQTGLEKAASLPAATAVHFVVLGTGVLQSSLGEAEGSALLRVALDLGLESFPPHGQKLLAHACGKEIASRLADAEVDELLKIHLDTMYIEGRSWKQTVADARHNAPSSESQAAYTYGDEPQNVDKADTSTSASDQEDGERPSYGERPSSGTAWTYEYENAEGEGRAGHFSHFNHNFNNFAPQDAQFYDESQQAPPARQPLHLYHVKNTFVEMDEADYEMQQVRLTAKTFRSEDPSQFAAKFASANPMAAAPMAEALSSMTPKMPRKVNTLDSLHEVPEMDELPELEDEIKLLFEVANARARERQGKNASFKATNFERPVDPVQFGNEFPPQVANANPLWNTARAPGQGPPGRRLGAQGFGSGGDSYSDAAAVASKYRVQNDDSNAQLPTTKLVRGDDNLAGIASMQKFSTKRQNGFGNAASQPVVAFGDDAGSTFADKFAAESRRELNPATFGSVNLRGHCRPNLGVAAASMFASEVSCADPSMFGSEFGIATPTQFRSEEAAEQRRDALETRDARSGQSVTADHALKLILASMMEDPDSGSPPETHLSGSAPETLPVGADTVDAAAPYIVKNTFIQFPEAEDVDGEVTARRVPAARFCSAPMKPVTQPLFTIAS